MRVNKWTYKVIITYKDGMTSTEYYWWMTSIRKNQAGVKWADIASYKIFPYGGVIA